MGKSKKNDFEVCAGRFFTEAELDLPGPGVKKNEDPLGIKLCVFRIWYKKKYVVWYGTSLWGAYYHFKRGFANFSPGMDVYHNKIYTFMFEHPGSEITVELLFETESQYQLLKYQQLLLNHSKRDQACLNTEFWAYLPIYNKAARKYGNFNLPAIAAYKRLITSERYLKQTTGF